MKKARPKLPLFLLAGRHEIVDQHRAMGKDISGLFRKPFGGQDLLAAIDRALRGSDVEEENDR